ncbi:MAG TPA: Gfo/Idh/MocA family oxidoreductase, partial [Bacteroidia bacterium]|nr:Gfo/Idh/MocA family oxidoreductase [Bacteroidia bacterium]
MSSEKKEKIKFAVIGCGHIGKRHAEMVRRNNECELVAMCDIRQENEVGIADFNVPFFQSVDAMLTSIPDIDVVCVCSPNGVHAEHSLKA